MTWNLSASKTERSVSVAYKMFGIVVVTVTTSITII